MKVAGVALCLALAAPAFGADDRAWVKESDEHAQVLLRVLAQFEPETAGEIGVEGFDAEVLDLKPQLYERSHAALQGAAEELRKRLATATHPAVRQDLEIMIDAAEDNLRSDRLARKYEIPYFAMTRTVFLGIRGLLDPRVPKARQALALTRLRRYAGLEAGYEPIVELAKARTRERLGEAGLLGPFRGEVEQNLADTPRLLEGLKALFKDSGLDGSGEAVSAIEKQLLGYDEWVRVEILPRARTDHRLPAELYADALQRFGVDIPPEEILRKALVSFAEIRNEMRAVAARVARDRQLKSADYRDVIRALKKKQVTGEAILPLYRKRLAEMEKIVQRENVVTLPSRKASIRLATAAESAIIPAPYMDPPRLIGNTGEYGEFVLPLKVPGKGDRADLATDDFSHDAAAWTLTVHEARPGHEMQFARMLERGVSIARGVFAFNSVNVEGWALYAEAEMKPYLPADGQLISLQHRLMRAARAFLDPMVNLGQITPDAVKAFLVREVVLSEGMAQQEVDRYTFRAPGQATSYFYGYQRLMETRQKAELALGEGFDRKAFHDFVLDQGMLPPPLLERAVLEEFARR